MRRPSLVIVAVVVVAAVVIGVVQSSGTSAPAGGGAPSSAAAQRALAGSPPALAALHEDANQLLPGEHLDDRLRALRGHPVVVNVWGSWCAPCREEFPVFQRVAVQTGRRIAFLGIDTQDPAEDARRFLRAHPLSYPSYQDLDGKLARSYGLLGTPSTVFYDAKGKRAFLHQGPYRSDADLRADIRRYASG